VVADGALALEAEAMEADEVVAAVGAVEAVGLEAGVVVADGALALEAEAVAADEVVAAVGAVAVVVMATPQQSCMFSDKPSRGRENSRPLAWRSAHTPHGAPEYPAVAPSSSQGRRYRRPLPRAAR
jgi:hypothetical protein